MKINKFFAPTIFFIVLIALTGCNTIKLDSTFISNPINIDGDYSDWEKIPALYFENQEVLLALSNDKNNLYLAFRFRDPKWLMAIRKTGLTIWLDNSGKKNKQFGVRYSGGPRPQDNIAFERFRKSLPNFHKQNEYRYIDSTKLFAVLNSEWWYKEQNIPADGTFGPKVKYGFEHDMYTYEFAVPLSKMTENFYGMNALPGQTISIGLEFGDLGMRRPGGNMGRGGGKGGGMGGGGRGGMGGGTAGGRGGGMGGGRGGGDMRPGGMGGHKGGSATMPEEQKIWIKTKLATLE